MHLGSAAKRSCTGGSSRTSTGDSQIKEKRDEFENFTANLLLFHCSSVSLDKFRLYAHSHNQRPAMLNENSNKFPLFPNMDTLSLERCLVDDECSMGSRLDDLGSFLENAPSLEKLTLPCCMILGIGELRGKASPYSVRMGRLCNAQS
ncbi:hypothetical protein BAE44_0013429 [Dichanthelium oligosanthes]|uniref:Uncharacterized protein n=1 Tax=Dichanthelium oligosanthes TaxID=888268 RepID=A0A1E5VKF3_9POAL|nr:hypothetical protein BAE44_0013429 [Dichanthelium oligosanthes]